MRMYALLSLAALIGCGGPGAVYDPSASSGVLLFDGAAVDPWCGAVLVREDAVLTAAHCVESRSPAQLQFTFDDQRSPYAHPLRSIELADDLALAILETPVIGREPAQIGIEATDALWLMSTWFVPRGEPFQKLFVEGVATEGPDEMINVRFPPSSVNCHGESGTGLYSGDLLVGIGVGAFASEPANELGCLDVLMFAPVAERQRALRSRDR